MCGIFGWQFQELPNDRTMTALVTALAFLNARRGEHGYGFFTPAGLVTKGAGSVLACPTLTDMARLPVVIGHTRYATVGNHQEENAHPFEQTGPQGTVIGCHNGAIWNWLDLEKEERYASRRKFRVDSQHLIQHLADGAPIGELEGYGTAFWVAPAGKARIHLARFSGQLCMVQVNDGQGVVWSSDDAHCEQAVTIAGLKPKLPYQVKDRTVYYLDKATLYTTDLPFPVKGSQGSYVRGGGRFVTENGVRVWRAYGETVDYGDEDYSEWSSGIGSEAWVRGAYGDTTRRHRRHGHRSSGDVTVHREAGTGRFTDAHTKTIDKPMTVFHGPQGGGGVTVYDGKGSARFYTLKEWADKNRLDRQATANGKGETTAVVGPMSREARDALEGRGSGDRDLTATRNAMDAANGTEPGEDTADLERLLVEHGGGG